jgi:hypothetical protein
MSIGSDYSKSLEIRMPILAKLNTLCYAFCELGEYALLFVFSAPVIEYIKK